MNEEKSYEPGYSEAVKEILCQQLALLAEWAKSVTTYQCLIGLNGEMARIAELILDTKTCA